MAQSRVIKVGDDPVPVHGTFAIHLFSPGGPADLENTHFLSDAASWVPVIKLDDITGSSGVVLELAGHCRLTGDANAQCSLVAVSIGGKR